MKSGVSSSQGRDRVVRRDGVNAVICLHFEDNVSSDKEMIVFEINHLFDFGSVDDVECDFSGVFVDIVPDGCLVGPAVAGPPTALNVHLTKHLYVRQDGRW